jgi:hypothetical protein
MSSCRATPRGRRRGIALLTTLALLALAGALLAGGFVSATASARATRSSRAGIVAEQTARRALGKTVIAWSRADDSLPIGGVIVRAMPESAAVRLDSADTRVRVQRISADLFVIATDVTVPASGPSLARRRARLLVERRISIDTTQILPPHILSRWPVAGLY